jgi:hypothetical protein
MKKTFKKTYSMLLVLSVAVILAGLAWGIQVAQGQSRVRNQQPGLPFHPTFACWTGGRTSWTPASRSPAQETCGACH